jgi:hypothetical protein
VKLRKVSVHFLLSATLLLWLTAITPEKASAQLATFDASGFAQMGKIWNEDVSTNTKLAQELAQALKLFNQTVQIYGIALQETQFLKKGQVLQAIGFAAQHAYIPGHTQWDNAMTAAGGVAYAGATVQQLMTPGQSMQNRILMSNSFATSMLSTLGSCNVAAAQNQGAAAALQQMAMDMNPAANSRANQANLTNLGIAQQLQIMQCQQNMQREEAKAHLLNTMQTMDRDQSAQSTYANVDTIYANNPMWNTSPAADLLAGMN